MNEKKRKGVSIFLKEGLPVGFRAKKVIPRCPNLNSVPAFHTREEFGKPALQSEKNVQTIALGGPEVEYIRIILGDAALLAQQLKRLDLPKVRNSKICKPESFGILSQRLHRVLVETTEQLKKRDLSCRTRLDTGPTILPSLLL
jgi:hypothetical protein